MLTEYVGNGHSRELPKGLELQLLRDHAAAVFPALIDRRVQLDQEVHEIAEWLREVRGKRDIAAAVAEMIKGFLDLTEANESVKMPF